MGEHKKGGGNGGQLLSLAETIRFLGISKQTLYRMLERGDLRGTKVGRQWRFRRADLEAYVKRGPAALAAVDVPVALFDTELAFFAEALGSPVEPVATADPGEEKVATLAEAIVRLALKSRASDIHLEPARLEGEVVSLLRYRVDGMLQEARRMPLPLHEALILRFKQMGNVDPEERAAPQDGRAHLHYDGRDYDLRVAFIPTTLGPSLVGRLLDRSSVLIDLEQEGLEAEDRRRLQEWLGRSQGLVLITGPTGSGRTTTAYGLLRKVARPEIRTYTIEEPVEYQLPWVTHIQVNRKAGLTFAAGMRSLMRHDPDALMLGDIRDQENAMLAVQAALTGHRVVAVMASLRDTPSALTSLVDIGVEPFLLTRSLLGVVAKRLVRRICPECKDRVAVSSPVREELAARARAGGYELPTEAQFFQGTGCPQCRGFGYRGRIGIFSLLEMTPGVRDALLARAGEDEIMAAGVRGGMHSLAADGIRKAAAGLTTVEEVLRVLPG